MEREKKMGRGIEDFSHLFLSHTENSKVDTSNNDDKDSLHPNIKNSRAPVLCITSIDNIQERLFLIINLSYEISRYGKNILIIDNDYSMPRLCLLIDNPANDSILNIVLQNGKTESSNIFHNGIKLLTIDADLSDISSIGIKKKISLIRYLKEAEEIADLVIINSAPNFGNSEIKEIFTNADANIILSSGSTSGLINSYSVIKTIDNINKESIIGILLNGINTYDQSMLKFERIREIAKKFLNRSIINFGYIPNDIEIGRSLARKEPLSLMGTKSKTLENIKNISEAVLDILNSNEDKTLTPKENSLTRMLFKNTNIGEC